MLRDPVDLMTPRILVVDDERQIHSSLRLRLGRDYELVFCLGGQEALKVVAENRFDLCFADIHMPQMDGIAFVDAARKVDPGLGYVIISAFDTDENLRRTIPLQVYDFISKPLPERNAFEARIPGWVETTRQRRHERQLAQHADSIAADLGTARIEREVELLTGENARAALRQTSTFLTTVNAHLVAMSTLLAPKARADHAMAQLNRYLEAARRASEAAITATEGFFDSSYGGRDTSPAVVNDGIDDAIEIALRTGPAEALNKTIDFKPLDARLSIRGITGINFLTMLVPALGMALNLTAPNTTIGIRGELCARLDAVPKDPRLRAHFWLNRRNASGSSSGLALFITTNATSLTRPQIEAWLKGEYGPLSSVTPRGLLPGIQGCQGLLGFSVAPHSSHFGVVLTLPV